MTILAVGLYQVLLTVHLIAVLLAFGPTFAYPFLQAGAERSEPRSIPYLTRVMRRIDTVFVVPGMLVVLITGVLMLVEGRISFGAPWVSAAFLIFFVLLIAEVAVLLPAEARMGELAERDIAAAGAGAEEIELSAEYRAVSRRFAMVGGTASLLILIAVVLMVLKPGG